jgi:SecD/SecF fusion protein
MKEFRFRIILILIFLGLSIWFLYPTWQDYQNNKQIEEILSQREQEIIIQNPDITRVELTRLLGLVRDSIRTEDPSIAAARENRIKLGLDLQGGMRVVLEVNTGQLLSKLAKSPDDIFKNVLDEAQRESDITDESVVDIFARKLSERGVRLSRYFGTIREDDSDIIASLKGDAEDAVARAMEIIRNRVDQYGVSEPSIQRQGTRRIIVELPGVTREEEAKRLLQGTALLEFRLLRDPEFTFGVMQKIDNVLAGKNLDGVVSADTAAVADTTIAADTPPAESQDMTAEQFAREHPFFSIAILSQEGNNADAFVLEDQRDRLQYLLNRPEVQNVIPNNVEFVFSAKPATYQGGKGIYMLYLVNKNPELTGGVIVNAQATIDPNTASPMVNMEMNSEGATEWARITGANINRRIAIILDGVVFSAPVVRGKIPGGRSQIEGMANLEEAKLLEIVLKAGALPAPVDIIEERTVGPSLGQDSVRKGFSSATIGFIAVGIFMMFYYRRSGQISALALTFTILFVLAVLAGFGATLTLPGIAGIILTMGMAVDANVLIFERIREELNTGKTVKASIDSGFQKAYSAIFDSNITTFFTGVILYQFGSGPIQGFALTLMIGIATSLFGALVISRVIFDIMVAKGYKITIG